MLEYLVVNRAGQVIFQAPHAVSVIDFAHKFGGRPGRYVFGTVQFLTSEHACHCGAPFNRSDHCDECGCEQYERYCEHVAPTHA
jgi:hypothetical protein